MAACLQGLLTKRLVAPGAGGAVVCERDGRARSRPAARPAGQRLALDWAPGVFAASALSHADKRGGVRAHVRQEQIGGAGRSGR